VSGLLATSQESCRSVEPVRGRAQPWLTTSKSVVCLGLSKRPSPRGALPRRGASRRTRVATNLAATRSVGPITHYIQVFAHDVPRAKRSRGNTMPSLTDTSARCGKIERDEVVFVADCWRMFSGEARFEATESVQELMINVEASASVTLRRRCPATESREFLRVGVRGRPRQFGRPSRQFEERLPRG
jgi:hypothetical protein